MTSSVCPTQYLEVINGRLSNAGVRADARQACDKCPGEREEAVFLKRWS